MPAFVKGDKRCKSFLDDIVVTVVSDMCFENKLPEQFAQFRVNSHGKTLCLITLIGAILYHEIVHLIFCYILSDICIKSF